MADLEVLLLYIIPECHFYPRITILNNSSCFYYTEINMAKEKSIVFSESFFETYHFLILCLLIHLFVELGIEPKTLCLYH